MKRALIFSLLAFTIWNYIGFYGYFHLEQSKVRKELKKKLKLSYSKEELKVFLFQPSDLKKLKWHKANEFEWNGGLYDIVYSDTLSNHQIQFQCISDKQETVLFAKLNMLVSNDVSNDNHPPVRLWKVQNVLPLICENIVLKWELFDYSDLNQKVSTPYIFSKKDYKKHLLSPPPQA